MDTLAPFRRDGRVNPKVPGISGGALTATMSPDSWRTKQTKGTNGQAAQRGSGHGKRFGVKPTGGAVADIWVDRGAVSAEYAGLAINEARSICRTRSEDELVTLGERCKRAGEGERAQYVTLLRTVALPAAEAFGPDSRPARIASLIREACAL